MKNLTFILFICLQIIALSQHKIIRQTDEFIEIEFNFTGKTSIGDTIIDNKKFNFIISDIPSVRNFGEPWLPEYFIRAGISQVSSPSIEILSLQTEKFQNINILPYPDNNSYFESYDLEVFNKDIYYTNSFFPLSPVKLTDTYVMRYVRVQPIGVSPYQYNPVSRELIFNKKLVVRVNYGNNKLKISNANSVYDPMTEEFIKNNLINPSTANKFIEKHEELLSSSDTDYWYNPNYNYFKIYLNKKGVYRITFEDLVANGVPISGGVQSSSLAMWCDGKEIPLDVYDGGDSVFNSGDYFNFVGYPVSPSPFSKQNIYNLTNVYWLTYQHQQQGLRYYSVDGFPHNYDVTMHQYLRTDHYEKDSIYEHLGYAGDGNRDFWYWGTVSGQSGNYGQKFFAYFDVPREFSLSFPNIRLRINMHGMTDFWCNYGHKIKVTLNNKVLGYAEWNGQKEFTFESNFIVGPDTVNIYPEGNFILLEADGLICHPSKSDEIRVNWFDLTYRSANWVRGNNFIFNNSPEFYGRMRVWLDGWTTDSMIVYVPSSNKLIVNPYMFGGEFQSVFFLDTAFTDQDYFCIDPNYYNTVDSIKPTMSSNLRDINNEADYIIITHPKFLSVAQRLKNIRQSNFPDSLIPNPRIKIVDVERIYDEFSFGFLDPYALQRFAKHAFYNWKTPAPSYIVLLGDLSTDYRKIKPTSRDNYIPSIPYQTWSFGQAASDNLIVAVAGDDVFPDMYIGRLSIETIEEGNILLDKIETYPADNGKKWKERVLLFASGLSLQDENRFNFNAATYTLYTNYIEPNGFEKKMIFKYPNQPEFFQFEGSTPDIRQAFNDGGILANYYGHGGGYQWDLTFLNEDIYLLQNEGRLPFILSVTCYTAHYDNQNIFGEQFNKVPGKGSLAFWGSSGLTNWEVGKLVNRQFLSETLSRRNYYVGKSIWYALNNIPFGSQFNDMVALLTLLGDPAIKLAFPTRPDFALSNSDISFSQPNGIVGDTIRIQTKFKNYGVIPLSGDSVIVEWYSSTQDTIVKIDSIRIPVFGNDYSYTFDWVPEVGNLFEIEAKINLVDSIEEDDLSDNSAKNSIAIFNLNDPSIVLPNNGFASNEPVKFIIADIGNYINKHLEYQLEIDTNVNFNSPIIAHNLIPEDGLIAWTAPLLPNGYYYWRVRIYDGETYGRWITTRTFQQTDSIFLGTIYSGSQLKLFDIHNVNYSSANNGVLVLNSDPLPPKPSYDKYIEDINFSNSLLDSVNLSVIATDGTYIYFANQWYFSFGYNETGKSFIYKIGTGYNGTVKGEYYGTVPNFYEQIRNSIVCFDGYIFSTFGKSHQLIRIDPNSSIDNIDTVDVPLGLLKWDSGLPEDGEVYLTADSNYVYNLAVLDSLHHRRYTLRIFNPRNNWEMVFQKTYENITSFSSFCGFFTDGVYFYPFENFDGGLMRRINIETGVFDEEWLTWQLPDFSNSIRFYSWVRDWSKDEIYATNFRYAQILPNQFTKFKGHYLDSKGEINTLNFGPGIKWGELFYDIKNLSASGNYSIEVSGYNKINKQWDSLFTVVNNNRGLDSINGNVYNYLKAKINFIDTSYTNVNPLTLNHIGITFLSPTELLMLNKDFTFSPDSLMQGFDITMKNKIYNLGLSNADSVLISFILNEADTAFYKQYFNIPSDSFVTISYNIPTSKLIFDNSVKAIITFTGTELYTFNNLISSSFYVSRDSIEPIFNITFDGREIINGDIISKTPLIRISLKDNSPLPLDTSYFTIILDNKPLGFVNDNLQFNYTEYPNSEAVVTFQPILPKGRRILDVLAKDASGNFFDTTFHRNIFYVYDEDEIAQILNYPNPFKNDTYFTFEFRGAHLPDELKIKVYTIAGRLIKELTPSMNDFNIGFNKIYWDGKDEDGDKIANGLYLYRVVAKYKEKTVIETKKMFKLE